jgi:CheY-like chemotaxis protein/anti-sigma regulatory factor (Ser/Thr protein kinase)
MPKILIVDDSPVDRQFAARILQKYTGWTDHSLNTELQLTHAADGVEGLTAAERDKPDLIVTDLNMPNRNGLELVEEVRLRRLGIPVILMTAQGSDEIAMKALQRGAASYVPKRLLAQELVDTALSVLEAAQSSRGHSRLMECITGSESHFKLDNDPALIPSLVGYLKDSRFRICGSDETGLVRVTMALREAVLNAMQHGNLELSSDLRQGDERAYHQIAAERQKQKPYSDRRVHVLAKDTPEGSTYVIRDEGPGFDPKKLPDPLDPVNFEKISGRGLLLIRTFMDEVHHNSKGNEITLVKRASAGLEL